MFSRSTSFASDLEPSEGGFGSVPARIDARDLDGNGFVDLIATHSGSPRVSVTLRSGSGSFAEPTTYSLEGPATSFAIGDFDDDAVDDIVVGSGAWDGKVTLLSVTARERSPPRAFRRSKE